MPIRHGFLGRWAGMVAVVAALFFGVGLNSAFAANLITNGDLETPSATASIPQGWASDYWGTITPVFTYPVAGMGGGKAAQVQVTKYTSGDAKWYFTHIPVTPGATYTFSDNYLATVPTNVTIEYLSTTGAYSYVWLADLPATGGTWASYTGTFVVPTGTKTLTVFHVIQSVGTMAIDNASLISGTTPPPPPPPAKPAIPSFVASPASITVGQTTNLLWSVVGASSTSIDQGVGIVTGTSVSVSPAVTTTYTITATNPAGSVSTSTKVTVNPVAPPPPPPPAPKPVITFFTATPSSILVGSSTMLMWGTTGASSTSISQGVGVIATTSVFASPIVTTSYVLTATNPSGSVYATTTVIVTTPPPPPPPPTSNLIANGNFEAGTTNAPTGWNSDYWGSLRATFAYPVTGNGGGKAAKVTVTNWRSGDAKWWFNHISAVSSTVYRYTEDYMSNVITNVSVEFKMSDGTYQYQWVANEPVANTWTPLTIEITVPTGAVSFSVLHALDKNGTLTIDNASVVALPANPFPQGMVTIVFDDGLVSQYNNARPILNTAGLKAMYAIITQGVRDFSGDTASMTWAQIHTLSTEGNEVGAHSRTHPDLSLITLAQAQTEIKGSYDDLVANGFTPKTFVYPLGGVNPAVEQIVKNTGFIGARGSYWGLNTPTADKYSLYDMRLDQSVTVAQAKTWIDQAFADKRWLILELHDVLSSGGDSYSITPATFQAIVTYIKQKGIAVINLQQGLALMQS